MPSSFSLPLVDKFPYIQDSLILKKRQEKFILLSLGFTATLLLLCLHKDSQHIQALPEAVASVSVEEPLIKIRHKSSPSKTAFYQKDFLLLLQKTEGFRSRFYYDNKGVAAAYGWNITKNTPSFNRQVAMAAGLDKKSIKTVVAYSQQDVKKMPAALANIQIDERKAQKSVDFLYDFYFTEFRSVFLSKIKNKDNSVIYLQKLQTQFNRKQKAVFAHMAYKVGKSGLAQYDNFFTVLERSVSKPRLEASDIIALQKEIVYSYQTREGEKKYDEKVQGIHRAEFSSDKDKAVIENVKTTENTTDKQRKLKS